MDKEWQMVQEQEKKALVQRARNLMLSQDERIRKCNSKAMSKYVQKEILLQQNQNLKIKEQNVLKSIMEAKKIAQNVRLAEEKEQCSIKLIREKAIEVANANMNVVKKIVSPDVLVPMVSPKLKIKKSECGLSALMMKNNEAKKIARQMEIAAAQKSLQLANQRAKMMMKRKEKEQEVIRYFYF